MKRILFFCSITVLFSVMMVGACSAEVNISFWPITQVIKQDKSNSTLWLQNIGKNNAELQFTIYSWTQKNGQDVYQDQQVITVAPPMIGLLPNEKRVIRMIYNGKHPKQEQAYRLVIDEIPVETPASQKANNDSQLSIHMRYVLPLFVEGSTTPKQYLTDSTNTAKAVPTLYWHLIKKQGQVYLEIKNTGPVHAHLADVTFVNSKTGAKYTLSNGLFGYVLPGSTMRWKMHNLPSDINQMQLEASFFDNGKLIKLKRWS